MKLNKCSTISDANFDLIGTANGYFEGILLLQERHDNLSGKPKAKSIPILSINRWMTRAIAGCSFIITC